MKPFLEEVCTTYVKCLCLNFHNLTELSTSVLQKYPLCQFWCQNGRDLRAFLRVKVGLKVLLRVKRLTFCNSGKLALSAYRASCNHCIVWLRDLSVMQGGLMCRNWGKRFVDIERPRGYLKISSIAKTPNIRCFVAKAHLLRFTRFLGILGIIYPLREGSKKKYSLLVGPGY